MRCSRKRTQKISLVALVLFSASGTQYLLVCIFNVFQNCSLCKVTFSSAIWCQTRKITNHTSIVTLTSNKFWFFRKRKRRERERKINNEIIIVYYNMLPLFYILDHLNIIITRSFSSLINHARGNVVLNIIFSQWE